ncbi:hypothetical protein LJC68_06325 [Bacteroidales bacterium OttesenSCG-928-B11]|nr:hypothetical protein [Bacteroidales bacterium OttesenSCG-928-C03]MDL2312476.1 hypothetical protein [Bacteroidales bacterium OttesenSCG-928-B11]MDL2326541.1 hypothetical protein [Bacteroidales bacterium OttesenSCG-928-A14]
MEKYLKEEKTVLTIKYKYQLIMRILLCISIFLIIIPDIYAQPVRCAKAGVFLPSMPACNNGNYYLVFEDNFDGNTLDLTKKSSLFIPIQQMPN